MLKEFLNNQEKKQKEPVGANGTPKKKNGAASSNNETDEDDPDLKKMKASLASAILTEKPNVQWDDVAGLEGAKEALKEADNESHGEASFYMDHQVQVNPILQRQ
ncbi:Putative Vacuolar protein sorting-associated protein 4 [Rhizopus microsporus]|nr:Putative Vacuolar protein sorting-associated protein 4 [Rhizopus microsporus]